jgi:hypothetical protein
VANKDAENGKCSGRKSYVESRPDTVALAKHLQGEGFSYRKIAGRLYVEGHRTGQGQMYAVSAIQKMLAPS